MTQTPAPTGAPARGRSRTAAVVVVLAVFMTNLDLWIVNVALPAMAASLGSSRAPVPLSSLSWG